MLRISLLVITIIVSLSVIITGCTPAAQAPAASKPVQTVVFAEVVPLTGAAASWGTPIVRAVGMAADEVNAAGGFTVGGQKYNWKVIGYDNKFDANESVTQVTKAVSQDNAKVVEVLALGQAIASYPVVKDMPDVSFHMLGGTSTKAMLNPQNAKVFNAMPRGTAVIKDFLPWLMKNKNVKTMALLNADNAMGQESTAYMLPLIKLSGIELVSNEAFPAATTDFYPILTKVLAKNPDMICTGATAAGTVGIIVKQAVEMGFKGVLYASTGIDPMVVVDKAGKAAEGLYSHASATTPDFPMAQELEKKYQAKYNVSSTKEGMSLVMYPILPAFTKAVEKANSFDALKIAAVWQDMTFDTCYGPGHFSAQEFGIKRQLLNPMEVTEVKNGKLVHTAWITLTD